MHLCSKFDLEFIIFKRYKRTCEDIFSVRDNAYYLFLYKMFHPQVFLPLPLRLIFQLIGFCLKVIFSEKIYKNWNYISYCINIFSFPLHAYDLCFVILWSYHSPLIDHRHQSILHIIMRSVALVTKLLPIGYLCNDFFIVDTELHLD